MPPKLLPESIVQEAIEQEFACERCGNCCKGDGVVTIGQAEAQRLAEYLSLTVDEFLAKYAIETGAKTWWLADQDDGERSCVFLIQDADGAYGCRVNPAKPDQCASYPAKWRNLDSYRSCAGLKTLLESLHAKNKA